MGPIRRVLVANRGEIARRVIRGAHDAGCEAVAVFAADDARGTVAPTGPGPRRAAESRSVTEAPRRRFSAAQRPRLCRSIAAPTGRGRPLAPAAPRPSHVLRESDMPLAVRDGRQNKK